MCILVTCQVINGNVYYFILCLETMSRYIMLPVKKNISLYTNKYCHIAYLATIVYFPRHLGLMYFWLNPKNVSGIIVWVQICWGKSYKNIITWSSVVVSRASEVNHLCTFAGQCLNWITLNISSKVGSKTCTLMLLKMHFIVFYNLSKATRRNPVCWVFLISKLKYSH